MMTLGRLKSSRAFTLLEMGIVVVVVGIVAITAIPAWQSLSGTRQTAAAEDVQRRLIMARSQAVSEGHPIGLRVDPVGDTVRYFTIATTGSAPTVLNGVDGQPDPLANIAKMYPSADITALVGGDASTTAQVLWFGYDGTPELRDGVGVRLGGWTTDAVITFAGGSQVIVRKSTGMVLR